MAKGVVTYDLTRCVQDEGAVGLGGARPATKAGALSEVEASLGAWYDAAQALVSIIADVVVNSWRSPETVRPAGGNLFAAKGAQSSPYGEVNLLAVEAGAFPAVGTSSDAIVVLD